MFYIVYYDGSAVRIKAFQRQFRGQPANFRYRCRYLLFLFKHAAMRFDVQGDAYAAIGF